MSGIYWWTTDVGGFVGGNVTSPEFQELLVRWYQYGALCPIFRTHGARVPAMTPLPPHGSRFDEPGAKCTMPGGGHASGAANEPWSYGPTTEALLVGMIRLRESLRGYIHTLAVNASTHGAPPMRPLLFDFPHDANVWDIDTQFMFGPRYMVAPILTYGARNRSVYFPHGALTTAWVHYFTNVSYPPGSTVVVDAPLHHFPLFVRSA